MILDKACFDCVFWVGTCKKDVCGAFAKSLVCSLFVERDLDCSEQWLNQDCGLCSSVVCFYFCSFNQGVSKHD